MLDSLGQQAREVCIGELDPGGGTNQTIGLQWAMQSLVASSPLAIPPEEDGYTYVDMILLFSDGLYTISRYDPAQMSQASQINRVHASLTDVQSKVSSRLGKTARNPASERAALTTGSKRAHSHSIVPGGLLVTS